MLIQTMAWTYKRRGKGRGDDEEKLPKKKLRKEKFGTERGHEKIQDATNRMIGVV